MKKLNARKPLEKDVQKAVVALYRSVGCWVENRAQGYRKEGGGTRQTPGIPDLMVWPPPETEGFLERYPWAPFFHEVKRPGGKQSPEQAAYHEMCAARGFGYVLGGVPEAMAHLRTLGLI